MNSDSSSIALDQPLIYHVFADDGVEAEALSAYGRVIRVGLNPLDTNQSEPIKADAKNLPLTPDAQLAVLHPPCYKWASATAQARSEGHEYDDLIPLAREIGEQYATDYIIENVPKAPLNDPVVLNGRMFGVPLEMERAFETSFHVEQPPRERTLGESVSWWEEYARPVEYWKGVKGYTNDYRKDPLVKSGIPRAYIDYLLRWWMASKPAVEGQKEVVA